MFSNDTDNAYVAARPALPKQCPHVVESSGATVVSSKNLGYGVPEECGQIVGSQVGVRRFL